MRRTEEDKKNQPLKQHELNIWQFCSYTTQCNHCGARLTDGGLSGKTNQKLLNNKSISRIENQFHSQQKQRETEYREAKYCNLYYAATFALFLILAQEKWKQRFLSLLRIAIVIKWFLFIQYYDFRLHLRPLFFDFFLALWSSPSMRPLYVNQLWTNFRNWLSSSTAYTTEFQWSSPAYLLHLSFVISWCTVLVSFSASRAPSISKINWINTPNIVLTNILTSRKGAWHNKTMIRRNKFEEKKWRKSNESSYLLVSFRNNFFWRTMPLQIINIMKIVCRSRVRNIFFLSCSVSYNNITSYTEYEFVDNIWISEQLIRCWMPWTVVQFIRFLPIDFIMVRIGDRTPISNARIIYR